MHDASKVLLAAALLVAVLSVVPSRRASASGGLTIAPARLTLSLASGQTERTASFDITNRYDTTVELQFSFEPALGEVSNSKSPARLLEAANPRASLAPQETLRQTIILRDDQSMGPGSQRADLVIANMGVGGSQVTVQPVIRLPIVLIKEEGAITSIKLKDLASGTLRVVPPQSVTSTVLNDGNMTAIPRGIVTVTGPDGSMVSRAVLNTESRAVAPGDTLAMTSPLTKLGNSAWPGFYRVNLAYGLGGGRAEKTTSATFFYIAWWHIVAVAALSGLLYYLRRKGRGLSYKLFGQRPGAAAIKRGMA